MITSSCCKRQLESDSPPDESAFLRGAMPSVNGDMKAAVHLWNALDDKG